MLNYFYRVNEIGLIKGNDTAVSAMLDFARSVSNGANPKPLLLYGPPGTGKTSAAKALANKEGWNVVEMNASDYRDRDTIKKTLLSAATSRSLFAGRTLILLDEIDDMNKRFDSGAGSAIAEVISKSMNPIIFIANDMWDQSISFLRNKTTPVQFKKLNQLTITSILSDISSKMGLNADKDMILAISGRSNGDARSAINDMMVLADTQNDSLEVIGFRDRKKDIFSVLDGIFMSNTLTAPMRAVSSSDLPNDMLMQWINENITNRYSELADLEKAFAMLSRASFYFNRAQKAQYYTYWRYMNVLMSSGVALSKSTYPNTFKRYEFPKNIKELSGSKAERGSAVQIAKKLQKHLKSSISRIVSEDLPMVSAIIRDSSAKGVEKSEVYDFFAKTFDMDVKEVDWLASFSK